MNEWAPTEEELLGAEWLEREKRREAGEDVPEPPDPEDEPTFNGAMREPLGRFWMLPEKTFRTDGRRELCDELEYEAVAIARGCGWSWAAVGQALGINASGAHRQFAQHGAKPRTRRPKS